MISGRDKVEIFAKERHVSFKALYVGEIVASGVSLTGMDAGLLTTTTSPSMCTMEMDSDVTGTSCLQQAICHRCKQGSEIRLLSDDPSLQVTRLHNAKSRVAHKTP